MGRPVTRGVPSTGQEAAARHRASEACVEEWLVGEWTGSSRVKAGRPRQRHAEPHHTSSCRAGSQCGAPFARFRQCRHAHLPRNSSSTTVQATSPLSTTARAHTCPPYHRVSVTPS